MIDLHSHILPGLDDGAKDWTDAINMAIEAVKQGIHTVVATPHHQNGVYISNKQKVLDLINEFNDKLQVDQIPLQILPGQEVRIYVDLVKDLNNSELLTLNFNKKYFLLEFPTNEVPWYAEQLVFDIQLAGFIPIIPHPEKNSDFMENPLKLYQLVKHGALTQLTAASLIGNFGKEVQKFAFDIIDSNLAQIIATDAHSFKGNRSILLKEGYNALENFAGGILTQQFKDNANNILEGKDIYIDSPIKIQRKKKIFGIF